MFINLTTHYKKQRTLIDSEYKKGNLQDIKLIEETCELNTVIAKACIDFTQYNEEAVFTTYSIKEEIADVYNMLTSYCLRHNISFDEIRDIIHLKNVRTLGILEKKK